MLQQPVEILVRDVRANSGKKQHHAPLFQAAFINETSENGILPPLADSFSMAIRASTPLYSTQGNAPQRRKSRNSPPSALHDSVVRGYLI